MKTDLVEIFQTIRAEIQPYATMGLNSNALAATFKLYKQNEWV